MSKLHLKYVAIILTILVTSNVVGCSQAYETGSFATPRSNNNPTIVTPSFKKSTTSGIGAKLGASDSKDEASVSSPIIEPSTLVHADEVPDYLSTFRSNSEAAKKSLKALSRLLMNPNQEQEYWWIRLEDEVASLRGALTAQNELSPPSDDWKLAHDMTLQAFGRYEEASGILNKFALDRQTDWLDDLKYGVPFGGLMLERYIRFDSLQQIVRPFDEFPALQNSEIGRVVDLVYLGGNELYLAIQSIDNLEEEYKRQILASDESCRDYDSSEFAGSIVLSSGLNLLDIKWVSYQMIEITFLAPPETAERKYKNNLGGGSILMLPTDNPGFTAGFKATVAFFTGCDGKVHKLSLSSSKYSEPLSEVEWGILRLLYHIHENQARAAQRTELKVEFARKKLTLPLNQFTP